MQQPAVAQDTTGSADGLPITILIFGASGDLTHRKLIPAIYNLFRKGRLPDNFNVIGMSRTAFSHDDFRKRGQDGVKEFATDTYRDDVWEKFAPHVWYHPGNSEKPEDYQTLDQFAGTLEKGPANRLFYMSVAPSLYEPIIDNLQHLNQQHHDGGWRRFVIEKPFGTDYATARALNERIHNVFNEDQVFRIDHYLGKETSQNILFFRFANAIFEPIWNYKYVDHIQVTVAENVDVGTRAGYYEQSGVVRDMIQNHLLQLLALTTMEPPSSFNADSLRNEKVKVLTSIQPIKLDDAVHARYEGYETTPDVAPNSKTPTYAALKLYIDNWRWHGVPIYLRSGKALKTKLSEVNVHFQLPPHLMFSFPEGKTLSPNVISIRIQPDEGIHLKFEAKIPGTVQDTRPVEMEFKYSDYFGKGALPDAYERLILDAIHGDAALFTRNDEIETAWKLIDPILKAWEAPDAPTMPTYPRGSWGPKESDALLARDGRRWGHDYDLHEGAHGG
jgi:glucose-6-phosphate 1-dehydrogenase